MSAEKRDFDKDAAGWDENPVRTKLANDIAGTLTRQMALDSRMDVLDFGCGTGLLSLAWAPRVKTLTGVDSSRGMLEVFAAKAARQNLANVRTQHLDLDRGDILTGRFDLIASSMTLHHIQDIRRLLHQLYHVTAPSGHLCIADLDLDGGQFHENNTGVFHPGFERATLRQAFADAGFENIRDTMAAEITKPTTHGGLRQFTVFLMTGTKK
jgi:2-polyprenyl-3-methyl-5-hydroxy-6-metoxy-1,4-benzoquinol methylase